MDVINSQPKRFDINSSLPQLGTINLSQREACFYKNPLDEVLRQKGFSLSAFLSWANAKGLLRGDGKNHTKNVKMPFMGDDGLIYKKCVRVIVIKIDSEDIEKTSEFST